MSVNRVFLLGFAGQDPAIRTLGEGIVAAVSLSTPDRYKDRNGDWVDNPQWHNVQVFGKTAEFVQKNVHKGSQLFVEGKLRYRKYTDRDGNERSVTEIIADNVQLLDRKQDERQARTASVQGQMPARKPDQKPVEDLPFDDDLGF